MNDARILILITQMERAGAQKVVLQLGRDLQEHGFKTAVATMYDKGGCVAELTREYGIPIVDLAMRRPGAERGKGDLFRFLRGLVRLFRMLRSMEVDILHTFTHYSNVIGPIVGRLARVPIVIASQRNSMVDASRYFLWLDRVIANSRLINLMTAVSNATGHFCTHVEGMNPDKVVVIPNGIDTTSCRPGVLREPSPNLHAELGIPPESTLVITVARLHEQKGHSFLLEAIPTVLARHPGTHFLFVGDGERREVIEADIGAKGLAPCVHLLGVRDDIPSLLAASDFFVLPSLWEGMPNAVLEAMSASLPIVASRVDGTEEVIQDGTTGVLVPPGDSAALATALERLLGQRDKAKQMGERAREAAVRDFSAARMVERYAELYNSLLAGETPSPASSSTPSDSSM